MCSANLSGPYNILEQLLQNSQIIKFMKTTRANRAIKSYNRTLKVMAIGLVYIHNTFWRLK